MRERPVLPQEDLDVVVEIVLDRSLAAAGDEHEALDPRRLRLSHDVGHDRAVEDVEQLLGALDRGVPDLGGPHLPMRAIRL